MEWSFFLIRHQAVGLSQPNRPRGLILSWHNWTHRMSRRIIIESLAHFDVNELNRLGAFARPMAYPFMALRTSRYLIEYHPGTWGDRLPQRIRVQWTYCHFNGYRPWMTCLCGRRVGKLYIGNGFLGCRQCGGMQYESQRRGRRSRLHLRATRIRQRLGDDGRPGIDPFPPRPWRMHRRTYACLKAKAEMIERKLIEGRLFRPRPRRPPRDYAFRAEYQASPVPR